MKKIFNNSFLMFVVGIVVASTSIVLASNYLASDIAYTPKDSNWKVNNVAEAINSIELSKVSTNYSTEEKVVGTWTNGKPIYQKTYTGLSVSVPYNSWVSVVTIPEADAVIAIPQIFTISNGNIIVFDGGGIEFLFNPTTKELSSEYNVDKNRRAINTITIQYTKTTDQATNS